MADPDIVESRDWHAIELAGHRIGIEERIVGRSGPSPVRMRRRHYLFLVDGVPTELWVGGVGEQDPVALEGLVFQPLGGHEEIGSLVDIVGLLRRPSDPIPAARSARRGVYRLGDREIVVERPLRAEIPAAMWEQLSDLVAGSRAATDGDCKEHAAALVDIAAAAGLEARLVGGLVYIESAFGTGFHPHAWAEVRHGVRWLQVDPILDQPLADATHIPVSPRDVVSRVALSVVEVR